MVKFLSFFCFALIIRLSIYLRSIFSSECISIYKCVSGTMLSLYDFHFSFLWQSLLFLQYCIKFFVWNIRFASLNSPSFTFYLISWSSRLKAPMMPCLRNVWKFSTEVLLSKLTNPMHASLCSKQSQSSRLFLSRNLACFTHQCLYLYCKQVLFTRTA